MKAFSLARQNTSSNNKPQRYNKLRTIFFQDEW